MPRRFKIGILGWTAWSMGLFIPGLSMGFNGSINPDLFVESSPFDPELNGARELFSTFTKSYDRAFRKTLDQRPVYLALYYRELSGMGDSVYSPTDPEGKAEARSLARQALATALRDTVNQVNLLYNIKEYGRAATSANVTVQDGQVNMEGPSLSRAGNHEEPSLRESFRSSLMLINNADFGLSLRSSMGSYRTHLTYFLAGHDRLGASLERDLFPRSTLALQYRVAPDEGKIIALLQLPLQF